MGIKRVAVAGIVGALVGVAAVLSVAAASDDVVPDAAEVAPAGVVVEVDATELEPLDRGGYVVEVEPEESEEVAPVVPETEPATEESGAEESEEVPPLPVGVRVYFDSWEIPDALTSGADVPCWQELDERIVCWFEGATDAESQG